MRCSKQRASRRTSDIILSLPFRRSLIAPFRIGGSLRSCVHAYFCRKTLLSGLARVQPRLRCPAFVSSITGGYRRCVSRLAYSSLSGPITIDPSQATSSRNLLVLSIVRLDFVWLLFLILTCYRDSNGSRIIATSICKEYRCPNVSAIIHTHDQVHDPLRDALNGPLFRSELIVEPRFIGSRTHRVRDGVNVVTQRLKARKVKSTLSER